VAAAARAVDEFLGAVPEEETGQGAPVEPRTFRCEGEYWTLAFAGRFCRLRDAKGLHHIAYLLGRPGEHVTVGELLATLDGHARSGAAGPATASPAALGDAGPRLDARARAAYRHRLANLRAEREDAERSNDPARVAAARAEMEFIGDELAAAIGLGGRDRRAASGAERARLTVTKRIKDAVARVQEQHPALGEHLVRTVRTGLVCAYVPGADDPGPWVL